MNKLRWKMKPAETGLRAVIAGPRGYLYHDGTTTYAIVSALRRNHNTEGWYWVTYHQMGVPHKNTCNNPVATPEQAKKDAAAYVQAHLS